jgi:hypothetical protein
MKIYNRKLYNSVFKIKNVKYSLEDRLDYKNYNGELNSMVYTKDYKIDYDFTQRKNIINGRKLVNKFSTNKNSKRYETYFDKKYTLPKYTKFKEYKIDHNPYLILNRRTKNIELCNSKKYLTDIIYTHYVWS